MLCSAGTMRRTLPDPAKGTRSPARRRLAAALGPGAVAMAAVAALGCGPSSSSSLYGGTASAQTSGQAAAELRHLEVQVTACNRIRRRIQDDPQTFATIAVGPQCTVVAHAGGDAWIGEPGDACTLQIDGRPHRLRVTDATATFAVRHTATGKRSYVDEGLTQVRIGGDEVDEHGEVRHLLFVFDGALESSVDAEDWCAARLAGAAKAARAASPAPATYGEANWSP